ncbi:MAG: phosphorylase family protein [Candidatus Doudnabacteria bacterium]
MRNRRAEKLAIQAADFVRHRLEIPSDPIGVILGTGWGDKITLDDWSEVPFEDVPGFGHLNDLEGHSRKFVSGVCAGRPIVGLSGRVHLHEAPADPMIHQMVRLQTEILMQLGVTKLIVTCAAGALPKTKIDVGNLVVIDGFITLVAPDMPLYTGEYCSPEDTISKFGVDSTVRILTSVYNGGVTAGSYAMVRGPFFEGRRYDKQALRMLGADIVGMSTLPEACVASLYGASVLALAFVTNDSEEEHSHGANLMRAASASKGLGNALSKIVQAV